MFLPRQRLWQNVPFLVPRVHLGAKTVPLSCGFTGPVLNLSFSCVNLVAFPHLPSRRRQREDVIEIAAFVAHTVRFLVVSLSSTLSLCLSLRSVRSRQRQCLCLVLPDRIVLLPVRVFSLLSRGRRGVRGCLSLHFHGFRTAPRHCRFPCVSTAHAAKTNCLLSLRFHLIREQDTSSCDRASVPFSAFSDFAAKTVRLLVLPDNRPIPWISLDITALASLEVAVPLP